MASSAAVAPSSSSLTRDPRPQAGRLPLKRGEIGYLEGSEQVQAQPEDDPNPLPARHPADYPPPPVSQGPLNGPPSEPANPETPSDEASGSIIGKRSLLRHRKLPKVMGIHFTTLALLCVQLLFFAGTIIGWVFTAMAISRGKFKPPPGQGNDPLSSADAGSSNIFVHVAFAVVALAQIVFLERRVFRVRAERYMHNHPGEMLPISLRRGISGQSPSVSIAPWSRPPLPTYAAALAASGVGTGDVEDVEIAQPPPPAYGKTRGSTLLQSGYLRNSLRVQAREHERDRRLSSTTERSDRPISFVSQDEEWEERQDADHARRIEEALAALHDARPVIASERI